MPKPKLRDLLRHHEMVRVLEAHSGLTGLIAENTTIEQGNKKIEFNAIWVGSLTSSLIKGKPDISVVDMTSRLWLVQEILDVTSKPVIVDVDDGDFIEHFGFTVKTLERLGVAALVIEDKTGRKKNSLLSVCDQSQDSIEHFCKKIKFGKSRQAKSDFMIIARIESLILKNGMSDALTRAKAYIQAGADGIIIHSKEKKSDEILEFCNKYKKISNSIPLIVIPTTYNSIKESELLRAGVKMVIYANQLLRSSYPPMLRVAESILRNSRSLEADKLCMPVDKIVNLIPYEEVK